MKPKFQIPQNPRKILIDSQRRAEREYADGIIPKPVYQLFMELRPNSTENEAKLALDSYKEFARSTGFYTQRHPEQVNDCLSFIAIKRKEYNL